jgi:hypothetical protein
MFAQTCQVQRATFFLRVPYALLACPLRGVNWDRRSGVVGRAQISKWLPVRGV